MESLQVENLNRWYGRRKGKKLTPYRQNLINTLLPKLRVDVDFLKDCNNLSDIFGNNLSEIWLEIGFGYGEHLVFQNEQNPNVGLIGCELFNNGVASLLAYIDRKKINNILIFDGDARTLLNVLPAQSLERVFLLFGDPWPKKRHSNRRFVNQINLNSISRILKNEGKFLFASDHVGYLAWTREKMLFHSDFRCISEDVGGYSLIADGSIRTRYQDKALKKGFESYYLSFERRIRFEN